MNAVLRWITGDNPEPEPVLEECCGPVISRLFPRHAERVIAARRHLGLPCDPVSRWAPVVEVVLSEDVLPMKKRSGAK